jgi:hypothetical protein
MSIEEVKLGTVKQHGLQWLMQQGPSTILLTLILVFLGRAASAWIPQMVQDTKTEMRQMRDDYRASLTELTNEFKGILNETRDGFRSSLDDQRQDFLNALGRVERNDKDTASLERPRLPLNR